MKTYDVKYDIDQEVKFVQDKQIITTKIDTIRINQTRPFTELTSNMREFKEQSGIKIDYLVMTSNKNGCRLYEWVSQEDISLDEEELIRKIVRIDTNE